MIEVRKLVKRYGSGPASRVAVDDLSFKVDKGEIVGFLGPNGAGKSTTLRILAGFLGMTSGTIEIAGHDIREQSFEARKKIGYMPEAVPLYPEMRVAEYLAFRAELKRVPRKSRADFIDDAMSKANVDDVANVRIGSLSKGYRQRVGLADALVARPPLLILDEPTAGLDPNQIRDVRQVIRDLGKEHTVLLSTHILSEVEASCNRVVVIAKGKLVAEGTMGDLRQKRHPNGLHLVVRGELEGLLTALRAIPNVASIAATSESNRHSLQCTWLNTVDEEGANATTEQIVTTLVKAGGLIREVSPIGSSLEELFAELTENTPKEPS